MLDVFGVTEETWRDAVGGAAPPDFAISETPSYLGRAVAALAADPDVSRVAGHSPASWTLVHRYGFTDVDGTQPDFGRRLTQARPAGRHPRTPAPSPFRL